MTKIAVGATIGESIRVIGGNFGSLIVLSWLPLIPYFLLSERLDTFFYFSEEIGPWWSMAFAGLGEMVLAVILVPVYQAWHRVTLGLRTSRGALGLAAIRRVSGRYVVYTMLIYAPFVPLFLGVWAVAKVGIYVEMSSANWLAIGGILAYMALWLWFAVRMAFLFVEIAIGAYGGFSQAWRATQGHAPKLAIIGAVAFVPILVATLFVLALNSSDGAAPLAALAIQCIAMLLTGVVWVSATSIAYRDVTGWTNRNVADVFE